MRKYVIVDIETTGLSKYKHAITEIAAIRYDGNKIVEEYQTLVNPGRHISKSIERLTGITNEMVSDARQVNDVLPEFQEFLADDVLVAHNATFDVWFLTHYYFENFRKTFDFDSLCTRRLANRLLPELPSKSLWALCQHYEFINERAHRALADARVTTDILSKFLDLLKNKWYQDIEEILKLQYDRFIR